ncbi:hypothetical protein JKP88DRAFT_292661 [Tribonema minus]|uniref:Uncharacterized protein n=1 Tax=Tribonema minus TaxID=303371 RepID=A0A836CP92_9STRA|nr:hypothetical protein JKP88DRAFT_292661 [Tribonema minus]
MQALLVFALLVVFALDWAHGFHGLLLGPNGLGHKCAARRTANHPQDSAVLLAASASYGSPNPPEALNELQQIKAWIAAAEARRIEVEDVLQDRKDDPFGITDKNELRKERLTLMEHVVKLRDSEHRLANAARAQQTDADLQAFWRALPSATWMHDNRMLVLQDGTFFLGDYALGNRLIMRDFWYKATEEAITQHFDNDGLAIAVIGNTGIGKSVFGYLLLYIWACLGKKVAVRKHGWRGEAPYLFCAEGVFEMSPERFRRQDSHDPDIMYLVDGLNPAEPPYGLPTKARMVLLTSNQHARYKGQVHQVTIHSPYNTPKVRETYCFVNMLNADRRWGGNARYILQKDQYDVSNLDQEIASAAIVDTLKTWLHHGADSDGASSNILHFQAQQDLRKVSVIFASPYVELKIRRRAVEQRHRKLLELLNHLDADFTGLERL